jgi:uncharacterized protein YcbK (DUF882 family)
MGYAPDLGRRKFLALTAASAASLVAAPAFAMPRMPQSRTLAFQQLHTGEKLDVVYWAEGRYQPGALRRIDWLLRDFRSEDVHPIDPRLLDLLTVLRQRLGTSAPFQVISGYRSPATNAMLASMSEGVATNSLHMQGQAIDIRLPGRPLAALHRTALSLRAGGVGYYPRSNFVHVDVGAVRHW